MLPSAGWLPEASTVFIAEVCVGDNVDLSPAHGSSVGISGDCSDAQLLEQY